MSDKEGNWWEFYGVRYAQGTVVGAMMVFFLFSQHAALKKLFFIPEKAEDFGVPHLALLAVYGLTYCYIASAPILLLHAARGLLFESLTNPRPNEGLRTRIAWIFGPALAIAFAYYFFVDRHVVDTGALFLFSMLVCFQIYLSWAIFRGSWKRVIEYYEKIIPKRKKHADSGYVESYKHLREHGNSFLIVLFEFFLALPIYCFVSRPGIEPEVGVAHLLLIVLLWIMPASFIWGFGNKLETHLQNMQ